MAGQVKLVVDADTARAVQGVIRLVEAEKSAERGFQKMVDAGGKAERATVSASGKLVQQVQAQTRAAGMSTTQMMRAAAGAGASAWGPSAYVRVAQETSFARFVAAQNLRAGRNAASFAATRQGYIGTRSRLEGLDRGFAAEKEAFANDQLLSNFSYRMDKQRADRAAGFKMVGIAAMAATAAVYALDKAAERYTTRLDEVGAANTQFEKEMTPLLSLGDNYKNVGAQKDKVLSISSAMGMDRGSVADALFMLQSNAANLGSGGQKKIFGAALGLNQVAGGDLKTDIMAVTKLMQTYGKEMGTAQMASSKLLQTEDQAAITMDELAQLLPDVLPAAKLMGYSFDDIAASVITATQALGKNDKTLTGLRNMFLLMGDAQAKGVIHQGTLVQQLKELQQIDPNVLSHMFGHRTVAVVATLAEKSGEVLSNLRKMQEVPDNLVARKFAVRQADSAKRDADLGASLDSSLANVNVYRAKDPGLRNEDNLLKMARLGYESSEGAVLHAITPDWSKNLNIALQASEYASRKPGTKYGAEGHFRFDGAKTSIGQAALQKIEELEKVGTPEARLMAEEWKLRFGDIAEVSYQLPSGKRYWTGQENVEDFVNLYNKGYTNLNAQSYVNYAAKLAADPTGKAGKEYLDQNAIPRPADVNSMTATIPALAGSSQGFNPNRTKLQRLQGDYANTYNAAIADNVISDSERESLAKLRNDIASVVAELKKAAEASADTSKKLNAAAGDMIDSNRGLDVHSE